MDHALNNLVSLICHKIQPTNQPTAISPTSTLTLSDSTL